MDKPKKWQDELDKLQSIIQKTTLTHTVKWGGPVYTHKGKNILSYSGFKNHFVLVFFQGVFLKDPYKVLASASEDTKSMRHWRFTSMDQIDEGKILEYVKEAIENSEAGKEHKPRREKKVVAMPPELEAELKRDKEFGAAFSKLSQYQQKLYMEHVAGAKQEKTKKSRLERMKPMVLQGIGLHDKYKNI